MSIPNTPQETTPQTPAEPQAVQQIIVDAPAPQQAAPATAAPAAAPVPAPTYAAAPAAPAAPRTTAGADSKPLSITSFVLGLCSVVLGWTFIAPIVGLVLGILARKREPQGRTFANWGIGLNAAMLALTLIGLFLFFLLIAFMFPFIAADAAYNWS